MAIALRGANSAAIGDNSTGSPARVSYPTGTTTDDVILLFVSVISSGDQNFGTPTGFTALVEWGTGTTSSDIQTKAFYRVATGNLSGNIDSSMSPSSTWTSHVIVFSGCDTANPFLAWDENSSTTSSTTITTDSVANTDPEAAMVAYFAGMDAVNADSSWTASTTNSASLTEAGDQSVKRSSPTSSISSAHYYALNAGDTSTTCTGTRSATSADKTSWLGFLKPQVAATEASAGSVVTTGTANSAESPRVPGTDSPSGSATSNQPVPSVGANSRMYVRT